MAGGRAPKRANSGASRASQAASTAGLATAGLLQKTLTLNARLEAARMAAIMSRAPSASVAPTPIEPRPPAFETAAAMAGVETPAMGAWMIGKSTPRRSRNWRSYNMARLFLAGRPTPREVASKGKHEFA